MKLFPILLFVVLSSCNISNGKKNDLKLDTIASENDISNTTVKEPTISNKKKDFNYESIYKIEDETIKGDKNFNLTYSFKFFNKSSKTITNVLFSSGNKENKNISSSHTDERYEEINKEVNLKPGEYKILFFKTKHTNVFDANRKNEWAVKKIRFFDGEIIDIEQNPYILK